MTAELLYQARHNRLKAIPSEMIEHSKGSPMWCSLKEEFLNIRRHLERTYAR